MDSLLNFFKQVIVYLGVPGIIGALIYVGTKLQVLKDLKETTNKIKHNVKVISDFLIKQAPDLFDPRELQNYSPLSLTEAGKSLIEKLGFDNVFESNKSDFFSCIDSEKPKLKYDVEVSAIKSIYALSDKQYMNFLKVFFYNDPKRNLGNTAPTLGVYVRDMYLEEHPEITQ